VPGVRWPSVYRVHRWEQSACRRCLVTDAGAGGLRSRAGGRLQLVLLATLRGADAHACSPASAAASCACWDPRTGLTSKGNAARVAPGGWQRRGVRWLVGAGRHPKRRATPSSRQGCRRFSVGGGVSGGLTRGRRNWFRWRFSAWIIPLMEARLLDSRMGICGVLVVGVFAALQSVDAGVV
jgi:hypothetical protein